MDLTDLKKGMKNVRKSAEDELRTRYDNQDDFDRNSGGRGERKARLKRRYDFLDNVADAQERDG